MGHKPWDRAWRRADKARERNRARAEMYAEQLAHDPEIIDWAERWDRAEAAGDEAEMKRLLGDPLDIETLRAKYLSRP